MKKPILIAFEGTECSFKETQSKLLQRRLTEMGYKVFLVSYPNYDKDSSYFIREYLNGNYSKDMNDINPFVASSFYLMDFYDDYMKQIKNTDCDFVIYDRYLLSNVIHQCAKLINNRLLTKAYMTWLNKQIALFELPHPDLYFILHTPIDKILEILEVRKAETGSTDIHEDDHEYLKKTYKMLTNIINDTFGMYINPNTTKYHVIPTTKDKTVLDIVTISNSIIHKLIEAGMVDEGRLVYDEYNK